MVTQLSPELLGNFFEQVDNDIATLRSMSLVNRFWCRVGIPILWRTPFRIKVRYLWRQPYHNNFAPKLRNIIPVLISFLDSESRQLLKDKDVLLINSLPSSNFDYISFLRELDVHVLHEIVDEWLDHIGINTINEYNDQEDSVIINGHYYKKSRTIYLVIELCKLILRHSNKITSLFISNDIVKGDIIVPYCTFLKNLVSFHGASKSLSYLETLNIRGPYIDDNLLSNLSKICHNVSTLDLNVMNGYFGPDFTTACLPNFIKNQHNLQRIYLGCFYKDISPIIEALQTQIHSIIDIQFASCKFSQSSLMESLMNKCTKLRTITLRSHLNDIKDMKLMIQPLVNCNLTILQHLSLDLWIYEDNRFETIVRYLQKILERYGKSLNQLRLRFDYNKNPNILHEIGQHCINLNTLIFPYHRRDDLDHLLSLLPKLKNLKKLIIEAWNRVYYADEFFPHVGDLIIQTTSRNFEMYWIINNETIDTFLKKCNNLTDHIKSFTYYCKDDPVLHCGVWRAYGDMLEKRGLIRDWSIQILTQYFSSNVQRELSYHIIIFKVV
ncbi:3025_t:CDS:1 [Scutellospora calospora]|uniref:3025_t:CDS:1 n=1 Tax=Scutellospora calospora TaxID=85575 RepID=A0ACA9JUC4_9GLOM|nr:3025_t:CDS:1 [Scutellospora calospora]